jgi:uncharacterized protein with HEPN domain
MQQADLIRLKHMQDAADEIVSFTKNKNFKDFEEDRKLQLSVVHLLEIIGEAGASISKEIQNKYSDIPWKQVVGMRNRLIHGYFDIDLRIVWRTAKQDIPPLFQKLEQIVSSHNK